MSSFHIGVDEDCLLVPLVSPLTVALTTSEASKNNISVIIYILSHFTDWNLNPPQLFSLQELKTKYYLWSRNIRVLTM